MKCQERLEYARILPMRLKIFIESNGSTMLELQRKSVAEASLRERIGNKTGFASDTQPAHLFGK